MKRQKDRTRKGYYYAPVPLEIIEVLDNLAYWIYTLKVYS